LNPGYTAPESSTLTNCSYYYYYYFTLGSIQKLDRLQNTTKLAGMTCHLINKAVIKQNSLKR